MTPKLPDDADKLAEDYRRLYNENVHMRHALTEIYKVTRGILLKVGGGIGDGTKDPADGGTGGGGGGQGSGGGLFTQAADPADLPAGAVTRIYPGDDAANIINTGSTNEVFVFMAGVHRAADDWSDYIKPLSGQKFYGQLINGYLLQDSAGGYKVETGRCASIITGSRDISALSWTPVGGRTAWQATYGSIASELTVGTVWKTRLSAGGNIRNATTGANAQDGPPVNASQRETVYIAQANTAEDDFIKWDTAVNCQNQDLNTDVDGTRTYGGSDYGTPGATDWYLERTITTAFINYGTGVIEIGEDPTGKVITLSGGYIGGTGKCFGGSTNDIEIHHLRIEQFATDQQNGSIQGGGDRWDFYGKATGWTINGCHLGNHHGSTVNLVEGWTLQDTITEKCGQIGFRSTSQAASTDENITVQRVISRYNGTNYCYGWNTELGGCKLTDIRDSILTQCCVHDNFGPGIWLDVDVSEGSTGAQTMEVSRNITFNNYYGIFYELSDGPAWIHRNLAVDNGGFEEHGPIYPFTFRKTAQIRVGASTGNIPSATTKDCLVEENVAVVAPTTPFDAGSGGNGHNSHGITGFFDARSDANHIKQINNDVILPRPNIGDQRSGALGLYSGSSDVSVTQTRVDNMNSTSEVTGNNVYVEGGLSTEVYFFKSATKSDLPIVTLAVFEAFQTDWNSNQLVTSAGAGDVPLYELGCPGATFTPKALTRAARA